MPALTWRNSMQTSGGALHKHPIFANVRTSADPDVGILFGNDKEGPCQSRPSRALPRKKACGRTLSVVSA